MANNKVLIVDDDEHIVELIKLYMDKEGFDTVTANNGKKAVELFKSEAPAIVILDVMMPEMDGWQVCREIRRVSNIPIIMLTAKGETFDKVLGLELGADDYMVKPFEPKELLARVKAVLRRSDTKESNAEKEIVFPNLTINLSNYELKINGNIVEVPPKELELLYFLASNPNRVFTREQLLEEVWGFDYFGDSRTVDTHMNNVISVSQNLEYWTGSLQIEDTDYRARAAYKQLLRSWGSFLNSDIIVTNSNGEVLESTTSSATVPDELVHIVTNGNIVKKYSTLNGSYKNKMMVIGVPIKYQGGIVGASFYVTGIFDIRKTTLELFMMVIITSLFSVLAAFVLVYMQSKKISKPIEEINKAARGIASGKFDKRVEVTSADEIGQLASSFNFMADSIEALEDTRSEFISDVSHELRTPMTSISGFIEGILDGTIPPEKEKEYLKIVLDESKRLTKMVNDMLEMSKMSSSEYKLDVSEFDLNELTRICIIGLCNRIDEKNLELNVDFEDDILKVIADKDAIKRVVINLLDNAIKFSYPNTTIGIRTWIEDGRARFCVGNFGDGISGADLSNIFNRFYKTDKSRVNEKSGAGLGLSFVKNIMTLHKQNVWVESVDTKEGSTVKYTKFTFTLELA